MNLRSERKEDAGAVRAVHVAAFPTAQEAALVDALRDAGAAAISEVAVVEGVVAGHVLLSPMSIKGVLGLAPIAVLPELQKRGIGAALVRHALQRAKEQGVAAVVLVGDPAYYRRFGFLPARQYGLHCKWPGTEEAFMALELHAGALRDARGLASYHAAFDAPA